MLIKFIPRQSIQLTIRKNPFCNLPVGISCTSVTITATYLKRQDKHVKGSTKAKLNSSRCKQPFIYCKTASHYTNWETDTSLSVLNQHYDILVLLVE